MSTQPVATTPPTAPVAPAKKRRGRETVLDMVRSLSVVMLLVVGWFLFGAQHGSDEQAVRPVDPAQDIRGFRAVAPGAPLPVTPPAGWVPTVTALDPTSLRIGYQVPGRAYAEYHASTAPSAVFVDDETGHGRLSGTVDVGGTPWQEYDDGAGHTSLVRTAGPVTVLVGGVREAASLGELTALAGSLTVG
jgi:Protein of unknown function (DUF4245)